MNEQERILGQNQSRWAETVLSDKQLRAGSHPLSAMHGIDSSGVARNVATSGLRVVFVQTERPSIGGRNVCIEEPGLYVLAQGEGTFRSFACTHGYAGSLEIYDVEWRENRDEKEPMEFDVVTPVEKRRKIVNMSPPILGQFPLDANFKNGLVVRVECMPSQSTIYTMVWFLLADVKNGVK